MRRLWRPATESGRSMRGLAALSKMERVGLVMLLAPSLSVVLAFILYAHQVEDWTIKQRLGARPATPFSEHLVLIGLDERIAERTPAGEPTPKSYLADLVRVVSRYQPSVIALNFRLGAAEETEPGFDRLVQAADSAAARGAALVLPSVVATRGVEGAVVYRPTPSRFPGARVGYTSVDALSPRRAAAAPPAIRGEQPLFLRIRHFLPLASTNEFTPSFPITAVASHRRLLDDGEDGEALPPATVARIARALRLATHPSPDSEAVVQARHPRMLSYSAPVPSPAVTYFPADDFLTEAAAGAIPREWLRNRLVVVTAVAARGGEPDLVETPFGTVRGGIVLLSAIDDLLQGLAVVEVAPFWVVFLSVGAFAAVLLLWRRSVTAGVAGGTAAAAAYVVIAFLLAQSHVLLPLVWPLSAGLLAAVLGFVFWTPGAVSAAYPPVAAGVAVDHPHQVPRESAQEKPRSPDPARAESPRAKLAPRLPDRVGTRSMPRNRDSFPRSGALLMLGLISVVLLLLRNRHKDK